MRVSSPCCAVRCQAGVIKEKDTRLAMQQRRKERRAKELELVAKGKKPFHLKKSESLRG